jgi:hypothetical protein
MKKEGDSQRKCWTCTKPIAKNSNYPFCGTICKIKWEDKQLFSNRASCLNCGEEFFQSWLNEKLCGRKCKVEYYKAEINW